MKKIILFCQAPADIQYALTIYEREKSKSKVSIFCINVEGMYKFLSGLDLRLKQLVFIPRQKAFSFKNPMEILKVKIKLNKICKKYFHQKQKYEIYYKNNNILRYLWEYSNKLKDEVNKISESFNLKEYFYFEGSSGRLNYVTKDENKKSSYKF